MLSETNKDNSFGPPPHISVIIPTYRQWELLYACLNSLRHQSVPKENFEVVIVNNDAGDSCPYELPATNMRLIVEPRPGSYAARNTGIHAASGSVLAFTDADCIPEEQWLERGVKALLESEAPAFVGGRINVFARTPNHPNRWERFDQFFGFDQKKYGSSGFFVTANVFYERQTVESLGGFSEARLSGGDAEMGLRATAAGYHAIYEHGAIVYHPARNTRRAIRTKYRRIMGGRIAHSRLEGRSLIPLMINTILPPGRAFLKLANNAKELGLPATLQISLVLIRDVWWSMVRELCRIVCSGAAYERQ